MPQSVAMESHVSPATAVTEKVHVRLLRERGETDEASASALTTLLNHIVQKGVECVKVGRWNCAVCWMMPESGQLAST